MTGGYTLDTLLYDKLFSERRYYVCVLPMDIMERYAVTFCRLVCCEGVSRCGHSKVKECQASSTLAHGKTTLKGTSFSCSD